MKKRSYHVKDIDAIAQWVLETVKDDRVLCFHGEMGAGKTTLIKAIVEYLGGHGAHSPTFGIVNEYHYKNGDLLGYHFDFYRLEDESEALDLGFEEYGAQNTWQFIEWPDRIAGLLPEDAIHLTLEILGSHNREIGIQGSGIE